MGNTSAGDLVYEEDLLISGRANTRNITSTGWQVWQSTAKIRAKQRTKPSLSTSRACYRKERGNGVRFLYLWPDSHTCDLAVITHTNPVHALLYLIISLLAISGVFFSLGAYFAGALEIIVYAGAIMVLFVFVVMMLNPAVQKSNRNASG